MVGGGGVVVEDESGCAGGMPLCRLGNLNDCPESAVRTAFRYCSEPHTVSLTS